MAKDPVSKKEIRFNIVTGEGKKSRAAFPFMQGAITFGRAPGAEIFIEDSFASKKHCAVKITPAYVVLEDLGSRNGTMVNGHRVDSVEIKSGDRIMIGKTVIEVVFPPVEKGLFEDNTAGFKFDDTGEFRVEEATKREEHPVMGIEESSPGRTEKIEEIPPGHLLLDQFASGPKPAPSGDFLEEAYDGMADEDDDDIDEEEPYVPYFSLLKKIVEKKAEHHPSAKGSADQRVEIIESVNGEVLRVEELIKGQKHDISLQDKNTRFVLYPKRNECRIILHPQFKGGIYSAGAKIPLSSAMADGISMRGNRVRYTMRAGDVAEIDTGEKLFYVRFTDAPALPKSPKDEITRTHFINTVGSSIALHILIFIFFGFSTWVSASASKKASKEDEDRFVKLDLKDLEKKTPEPTPLPTQTPTPRPVEKKPVEVKRVPPKVEVKKVATPKPVGVKEARKVGGGSGAREVNVQATGVLASLGGLTTDTTSASNVMKAVSNLDAVRAPTGTKSNFSVSGLIGKTGSGDPKIVRVSGPSTGKGTDKDLGAIGSLGGIKGRGVGGIVVGDVPDFDIGIKGSLTREEVRRVIEKYVGEISYCYEKALFDSPGLEGKLEMFWEIKGNGTVGDVRIKRATLKSTSVNQCVVAVIKKMVFPKPRGGGVVQVSFPFVFNAASF